MKDKVFLFIFMPFSSMVCLILFSSFVDLLIVSMSSSNESFIIKKELVKSRNCYIFCNKYKKINFTEEGGYLIQSVPKSGNKETKNTPILEKLLRPLFHNKNDETILLTSKIGNTQLIYPKFPFRAIIVHLLATIIFYLMVVYVLFVIYPIFLDSKNVKEKQSKEGNIAKFLKVLIFGIRYFPQIAFAFFCSIGFAYNADQVMTSIKLENHGQLLTYSPTDEYKNDIFSRTLQRVRVDGETLFILKPYQSIFWENDVNQADIYKANNVFSAVPKLNFIQKYVPLIVTFILYILSILLLRKTVPLVIYYPRLKK